MNHFYSIKRILLLIFLLSFLLPITVMMVILPSSYKKEFQEETDFLVENNLELFSENLNSYLLELQKLTSYPLYKKDVINLVQSGTFDENPKNSISQKKIEELFAVTIPDYLRISRQHILSIAVHYDGETLFSNRNNNVRLTQDYNFEEQQWYKETTSMGEIINYIGSHKPEYFTHSETLTVFSVARNIIHPYREESLGVVIADADTAVFEEMLKSFRSMVSSITILLDEKNNILFSSRTLGRPTLISLSENEKTIRIGREIYSANFRYLSPSKWKFVILISQSELQRIILFIYLKIILISLMGFLLSLVFYNFLAKRFISDPINRMMTIMKEAKTGHLEARSIPNSIQEINSMGRSLNDMISQLNHHINTEYKLVLQQKNAEYKALQSQIQPHFIYNVLNGFFALNRMGKRETLEKSIMDLTGMLRYSFTPMDKASLLDELDFIKRYCALQQLRFEERLSCSIDCDAHLNSVSIPRLLIQPLVENAVKHGIEPLIRNCNIQIIVRSSQIDEKNFLKILVLDDGAGFNTCEYEEHVGLQNIRDRIKLLSPRSQLMVESSPGVGTSVTLIIPTEDA